MRVATMMPELAEAVKLLHLMDFGEYGPGRFGWMKRLAVPRSGLPG